MIEAVLIYLHNEKIALHTERIIIIRQDRAEEWFDFGLTIISQHTHLLNTVHVRGIIDKVLDYLHHKLY